MPSASDKRARGGVVRVRTIEGPRPGTYRRVYVVRKSGERGGRTIVGEVRTKQREEKRGRD